MKHGAQLGLSLDGARYGRPDRITGYKVAIIWDLSYGTCHMTRYAI